MYIWIAIILKQNKYVYILSEKSIATPNCFDLYLVDVATKEYCPICSETAFISEELRVKIFVVVATAEE